MRGILGDEKKNPEPGNGIPFSEICEIGMRAMGGKKVWGQKIRIAYVTTT